MNKELNIIQSEFERHLDTDNRKSHFVDKEACDQTHEFHKFSCGNKRTLKGKLSKNEQNIKLLIFDFCFKR